jgi:RNA:NAD 2'-phosphotransferase (TPT1/KptA family)
MNREDVIKLAREAGISESHARGMQGFLERFAALVSAVEREKSLKLWMLLDDVDTADDIAKADDKLYRSICQKYQKKRWEILSEQEVDAAIRARGQA